MSFITRKQLDYDNGWRNYDAGLSYDEAQKIATLCNYPMAFLDGYQDAANVNLDGHREDLKP